MLSDPYSSSVNWTVLFHEDFHREFEILAEDLQDELLAHAHLLGEFGPNLGRPTVDTLKGKSRQRSRPMARKLDEVMATLPKARQRRIEARALELATLKDLRQAAQQTQEQLAASLGVGQDTISRLERRSDMLLSTLRHYVQSMGGTLELVARFPNRPPVVIDRLGAAATVRRKTTRTTSKAGEAA